MKNLLSCASAIALCCFVHIAGNAQEHKWTASVHVGMANLDMRNGPSGWNDYKVYGKLPFDLAGYYPYFTNIGAGASSGAGYGRSQQISGSLKYQLNQKLNIGIIGFFQPETVGSIGEGNAIVDWQPVRYGSSNTFTVRSIAASLGFKFLPIKKGYFEANVILGTTFMRLTEMVYFESGITDPPGVFNGLAEDFIERKDWAFTWGLGIAYHYQLGKHWGLVAGFDFNTLNFQPDFGYRYSYKINGEEMVNSLSLRERQFIFSDELTDRPNEPNAGRVLPRESIRYVIPQISLGVTFGFL